VPSNYDAIGEENKRRYGTDIGRIGPMLLANRYDDRTHFIFELLQNAEDALSRRGNQEGPRKVTFELTPTRLTLSHFGRPFDEADVRGVCGIAESTKGKFSIGRFGIGFKSVYTFTDRPEIHSGDEDFAIENYVQPKPADRTAREAYETQVVLPLKVDDETAQQEITAGFRRLGPEALLFLQHIDEISWSVEGDASGVYLRGSPEPLGLKVQRITVIGQESGKPEVDQNWLVFHRDVFSDAQEKVGRVEVAFSLVAVNDAPGCWSVQSVAASPLVVFFPTVVPTNLGFLVQGPYRTTPSRDNIPRGDPWNQSLVKETASLLVEAMRWMRDKTLLDTSALRCLPLDRKKFSEGDGERFAPIFEAVRQAFLDEPLLPRFDGGFVPASQAKLARTQELRQMLSPEQIEALFGSKASAWLTGEITPDREPEIRTYFMQELGITEVTPATLVPRLTKTFLEAQSDEWMMRLYEFLSGQEAALRRRLDTISLIRLDDGTHVVARENGVAKAFLPSTIKTDFPTIRRAVCASTEARSFLISLGIKEPDPVDDVVWNLLPKYQQQKVEVDDDVYAADIERIRAAFNTDSAAQKDKLQSALRESAFVRVVNTGDGTGSFAEPGNVYIATERLQRLFAGVAGVFIVDNTYECLRGEDLRDVLVACGASRYLSLQVVTSGLGLSERARIRKEAGLERASWENEPEDFTLRGLTEVLKFLSVLELIEARARAGVLWDALGDLEGRVTFYGSYQWGYFHETKTARFDASFVRVLNQMAWVPSANGELVPPNLIVFDALGWKSNPFLLTKISFKPPIIDQLAKEAGIDPAVLDLLRKNPDVVAELVSRLALTREQDTALPPPDAEPDTDGPSGGDVYDNAKDLYGDDMPDIPPGTPDPDGGDGATSVSGRGGSQDGTGTPRARDHGNTGGPGGTADRTNGVGKGSGSQGKRTPGHGGGRPFISYVGTHPDEKEPDPDDLNQAIRMQIEDHAIQLIIDQEPALRRTAEGNPGFDLVEVDATGQPIRWVEVKSMTGSLADRPVGMSRTQFECARERGDAYWLYVVEHATDAGKTRILRIRDPCAHARTFTFDKGWAAIAE
jgi:hypothetical protein